MVLPSRLGSSTVVAPRWRFSTLCCCLVTISTSMNTISSRAMFVSTSTQAIAMASSPPVMFASSSSK
eukprot:CAMPEP_0205930266 /NCGR_PEP_ID=MMETSP1325-20131115/25790_1 /ASSEMBLY_ACC=CAM_ASM_000708 /TAXON_ID=236786 /ORGANISM="Florenciella sp., Strain RCC1007" /LENGTH=66 /DNA_ID=CAMNT_0053299609 /DNA_START=284 /DNA_END=484 /DNA_ORIENTATION=-